MRGRGITVTNNMALVRPWLWLVAALGTVLALAGCNVGASEPGGHSHEPTSYTGTELDGPAPDFRITDHRGASIGLSDFQGRVVALAFLDPHCTDVCPLTALHFQQAHDALGEEASQVAFLAVNVNPEVASVADTAEATRKWGIEHVPSWHFLTGSHDELQQVWEAYNVDGGTPKPDHHGEVQHSPGVYVIDQDGIQYRYISASFEDAPPLGELLVQHTRALLE